MIAAHKASAQSHNPAAQPTGASGPIFIGGLAHSGKTPLRMALSASGAIAFSRRTYMWNRFYMRYGDLSQPQNFRRCLKEMMRYKAIRELCADPTTIETLFAEGQPTYGRLFALFHEQYAQSFGMRRWGDQLGFVERFAAPIFDAYPTARMIHLIRDPRNSCEISQQFARFRPGKVGWYTATWQHSAQLARHNQSHYPGRYLVIKFEKLWADPEETLRELCAFLAEPYQVTMLQQLIPSLPSTYGGKMTGARVMGAPRRLSGSQRAFIQQYTRRLLHDFDYPIQTPELTPYEQLRHTLWDWPTNQAAMIIWRALRQGSARTEQKEA